jgi:hypothetical protein
MLGLFQFLPAHSQHLAALSLGAPTLLGVYRLLRVALTASVQTGVTARAKRENLIAAIVSVGLLLLASAVQIVVTAVALPNANSSSTPVDRTQSSDTRSTPLVVHFLLRHRNLDSSAVNGDRGISSPRRGLWRTFALARGGFPLAISSENGSTTRATTSDYGRHPQAPANSRDHPWSA